MYRNSQNRTIWRREILGLGLVPLLSVTISGTLPNSVMAEESTQIAKVSAELPVVRSAAMGTNLNVPWSKPVKIIDPFEGSYVGIFDKNYFFRYFLGTYTKIEIVSLWSRNSIRLLLTYSGRDCSLEQSFYTSGLGTRCIGSNIPLKVSSLFIKIGDQVFRLEGENSTFAVSNELAAALKKSPNGNVNIRLVAESGEAVDSEIGKGTVNAWKAIY